MKVVLPNGNVLHEPMLDRIGARSEAVCFLFIIIIIDLFGEFNI